MMRIGWSSAKKKVGIGRLIDWIGLVCGIPLKIPSLLEFRHCEGSEVISRNSKQLSSSGLS